MKRYTQQGETAERDHEAVAQAGEALDEAWEAYYKAGGQGWEAYNKCYDINGKPF